MIPFFFGFVFGWRFLFSKVSPRHLFPLIPELIGFIICRHLSLRKRAANWKEQHEAMFLHVHVVHKCIGVYVYTVCSIYIYTICISSANKQMPLWFEKCRNIHVAKQKRSTHTFRRKWGSFHSRPPMPKSFDHLGTSVALKYFHWLYDHHSPFWQYCSWKTAVAANSHQLKNP